jgi:hypothetical protein
MAGVSVLQQPWGDAPTAVTASSGAEQEGNDERADAELGGRDSSRCRASSDDSAFVVFYSSSESRKRRAANLLDYVSLLDI